MTLRYYPFGLVMAGISSKAMAFGEPGNRKKFNGIEYTSEFDLNVYDAFYRGLDPQVGRWWEIDPKIENGDISISPYASMSNNPILRSDPLGDIDGVGIGVGTVVLRGIGAAGAGTAFVTLAVAAPIAAVVTHPEILLSGGASAAQMDFRVDRQLLKASRESASSKSQEKGPEPNNGQGNQHGNPKHNNAIEKRIRELRDESGDDVRNIRKNQAQVDVNGKKVGTNRPDIQYDKYNKKTKKWEHHNVEYDNNKGNSERHGRVIKQNDPKSKTELNLL